MPLRSLYKILFALYNIFFGVVFGRARLNWAKHCRTGERYCTTLFRIELFAFLQLLQPSIEMFPDDCPTVKESGKVLVCYNQFAPFLNTAMPCFRAIKLLIITECKRSLAQSQRFLGVSATCRIRSLSRCMECFFCLANYNNMFAYIVQLVT